MVNFKKFSKSFTTLVVSLACLVSNNYLHATGPRPNSLLIDVTQQTVNTKITFSEVDANTPADGSEDAFSGDDGKMPGIKVVTSSYDAKKHGIYFNGEATQAAADTLTFDCDYIPGNNTPFISSKNTTSSNIATAAAVDVGTLKGTSSSEPFTISFTNDSVTSDKFYKFTAEATAQTAEEARTACACGIGVVELTNDVDPEYIVVEPNSSKIVLDVRADAEQSSSSDYSVNAYAVGMGVVKTTWENSLVQDQCEIKNITFGDFGSGTTITVNSVASGTQASKANADASAAIFGAAKAAKPGWGSGQPPCSIIDNWKFGNFDGNVILNAKSDSTSAGVNEQNDKVATATAAAFGVADGRFCQANGWKIGNFGNNLKIIVTADSKSGIREFPPPHNSYSVVFGVGDGWMCTIDNWGIGNFSDDTQLTSLAYTKNSYAYSSVFGAAYINESLNGWKVGKFKDNITINSAAYSQTFNSFASIFGAGDTGVGDAAGNQGTSDIVFGNWSIGDFGNNVTLSASSGSFIEKETAGENYKSSSFCTVFGTAYANGSYSDIGGLTPKFGTQLSDWTIGSFGGNASLTASSYYSEDFTETDEKSSSCSCVVGAAAAHQLAVLKNWTIEFQGNAVIAAFAHTGYRDEEDLQEVKILTESTFVRTLGGERNSDFRYYFNDLRADEAPEVVVLGAKLKTRWTVSGEEKKTAKGTLCEFQGHKEQEYDPDKDAGWGDDKSLYAMAVSLGDDCQINVGRARELEVLPDTSGTPTKTQETANSRSTGGKNFVSNSETQEKKQIGPGVLNFVGAICSHSSEEVPDRTIMRIDSGWTVNCFSPVKDLRTIEIINGSLAMMDKENAVWGSAGTEFQNVTDRLNDYVAYTRIDRAADHAETGIYQTKFPEGAERKGTVVIDTDSYPIYGTLTLDDDNGTGDAIICHVDSLTPEAIEGSPVLFHKADGIVRLPVSGKETNKPHLILNGKWQMQIVDKNWSEPHAQSTDDEDTTNTPFPAIPPNMYFWLVRANQTETKEQVIGGNAFDVNETPEETEAGVEPELIARYKINGGHLTTGNEYYNWEGVDLYWINEEFGSGIIVGTGKTQKATFVETPYTRDFASAELTQVSTDSMLMVRNGLQNRLGFLRFDSDDPFISIIGSHSHQQEIAGFGYNSNIHGVLCGLDFMHDINENTSIRYGAVGSCARNRITFFGTATARGKWADQDMYFGGLFGAYETFNAKGLRSNINLLAGYSLFKNTTWRTDMSLARFDADFDSEAIHVNLECIKNVFQVYGVQVGVWAAAFYNRIHEDEYIEHSDTSKFNAKLNHIDFNSLDTILGLNIEKKLPHSFDPEKRIELFFRAGWNCRPILKHTAPIATIATYEPFTPELGYCTKHSASVTCGFVNRLDEHCEISGSLLSQIGNDHHWISGELTFGYSF